MIRPVDLLPTTDVPSRCADGSPRRVRCWLDATTNRYLTCVVFIRPWCSLRVVPSSHTTFF